MTMTRYDFSPLYRSAIGFDRLAQFIDSTARDTSGYPPYNIELLSDDDYVISMAVAGFAENELDIEIRDNVLTISGKKENKGDRKYLYQGLSERSFKRSFQLTDYIVVKGAALENGLLNVQLQRIVPETLKPRKIAINSEDETKATITQSTTATNTVEEESIAS